VRRLLANVPTYMTFDDHEVTDDWFLNPSNRHAVLKTALGRRIVANGMAAFWLFQGTANDFQYHYKQYIADALTKHTRRLAATRSAESPESAKFESTFTGLRGWDFVAPTSPPVLFLDTRTRRSFSADERQHTMFEPLFVLGFFVRAKRVPQDAPRLVDFGSRRLRDLIRGIVSQRETRLVLVVPTPVYGLESIEKGQDFAVTHRLLSGAGADFESCHADPNSFLDIAAFLAGLTTAGSTLGDRRWQPELVVILSGDVHYAFSVSGSLLDVKAGGRPIPIAQFTSSATKNQAEAGFKAALGAVASTLLADPATLRFWWRKGSAQGAHSSLTVPAPSRSGNVYRLRDWTIEGAFDLFRAEAAASDLQLAEAFQFEKASRSSLVEIENNMGFLEVANFRVANRLMKWTGTYQEALKTVWDARSGRGWPVVISP
jgi:hypothetical protein